MKKTELLQSLILIAHEINQHSPEKIKEMISGLKSNEIEHEELGIPFPIDERLWLLSLETGVRVNEMLKSNKIK